MDGTESRQLTSEEIALLRETNAAESWERVTVADPFVPDRVRGCRFSGEIHLGAMTKTTLSGDWAGGPANKTGFPVGIYDSYIRSCTIGDNVSIDGVGLLSGYEIGQEAVICRTDEIAAEGEFDVDAMRADLINENGGRNVLLFPGMKPEDGYMWAKRRDNRQLLSRFEEMARSEWRREEFSRFRIGERTLIKNSTCIHNAVIGSGAVIDGAGRLDTVVVMSCAGAGTTVGDGAVLRNGIVGYRNSVTGGVTARVFLTGTNVSLSNGVIVEHSIIGDNAHLAAGEVLSALIFPFHEQHHRSSFLCAAFLGGQSNVAAGSLIGSNHNSRRNDGELFASRGFWPGLCSTFKHNSRFASFTLVAKGHYPYELSVPFPFSLVSRDAETGGLIVMPAYWLLYDMYALERNARKYRRRDKSSVPGTDAFGTDAFSKNDASPLEFDYCAPDTVEEMRRALRILELWVGELWFRNNAGGIRGSEEGDSERSGPRTDKTSDDEWYRRCIEKGGALLRNDLPGKSPGPAAKCGKPGGLKGPEEFEVTTHQVEASRFPTKIIKWREAYRIYREMILLWAMSTLMKSAGTLRRIDVNRKSRDGFNTSVDNGLWINLGGRVIHRRSNQEILRRIISGDLSSWEEVHTAYAEAHRHTVNTDTVEYAGSIIKTFIDGAIQASRRGSTQTGSQTGSLESLQNVWAELFDEAVRIKNEMYERTKASRQKDYTNPYRKMVYDSEAELEAVIGKIDDDEVLLQLKEETEAFVQKAEESKAGPPPMVL